MSGSTRDVSRAPTHPGAFFREVILPALGISKSEVARALGVSRHTLYQLLDEHGRVTPEMAMRLGKLCGDGPEVWMAMQLQRDIWEARISVDVSTIPTLSAA